MDVKKSYLVFSFNLMQYLDKLGIKFFAVRPDIKDSTKAVFIYEDTKELRDALNNYKK